MKRGPNFLGSIWKHKHSKYVLMIIKEGNKGTDYRSIVLNGGNEPASVIRNYEYWNPRSYNELKNDLKNANYEYIGHFKDLDIQSYMEEKKYEEII